MNSMSSMISWRSHPSYARVKEQCTIQLQKDAKIPLAHKSKATSPMDLKTYKCFLEYVTARLSQTFGVNLQEYIKYCNAYFAATTSMFGGPRGSQELADLSILFFVKLDKDLLEFRQSAITKGNQLVETRIFVLNSNRIFIFWVNKLYSFLTCFGNEKCNRMGHSRTTDSSSSLSHRPHSNMTSGLETSILERTTSTLLQTLPTK